MCLFTACLSLTPPGPERLVLSVEKEKDLSDFSTIGKHVSQYGPSGSLLYQQSLATLVATRMHLMDPQLESWPRLQCCEHPVFTPKLPGAAPIQWKSQAGSSWGNGSWAFSDSWLFLKNSLIALSYIP